MPTVRDAVRIRGLERAAGGTRSLYFNPADREQDDEFWAPPVTHARSRRRSEARIHLDCS